MSSIQINQTRKILTYLQMISTIQQMDNPQDEYPLDRRDVQCYLPSTLLPGWLDEITDFVSNLTARNEKVIHVDVCGRADALSMGVTKSFIFYFKNDPADLGEKNRISMEGDIFNRADFMSLIRAVKEDGGLLAFITFAPKAGLNHYGSSFLESDNGNSVCMKVTYSLLKSRLVHLMRSICPGGYIFLERPFKKMNRKEFAQKIPQEEYDLSVAIKKIAEDNSCTVKIIPTIIGPHFLVRKNF